jgi:hypothetical protein
MIYRNNALPPNICTTREVNKNIILTNIYKEISENVSTEYLNMNKIWENITQMDYCAKIQNFKSKFGKQVGVSCGSEDTMYWNKIVL